LFTVEFIRLIEASTLLVESLLWAKCWRRARLGHTALAVCCVRYVTAGYASLPDPVFSWEALAGIFLRAGTTRNHPSLNLGVNDSDRLSAEAVRSAPYAGYPGA
jgi:hypothetical protein